MKDTMPKKYPKLTAAVESTKIFQSGPFKKCYAPYGVTSHEMLSNPLCRFNTGQRHTIAAPQYNQSMVLLNPDQTRNRSGSENEFLNTLLDEAILENCSSVEFIRNFNFNTDTDVPDSGVLIVQNSQTKTLDYVEIKGFQVLSPGIGYINRYVAGFRAKCQPFAPLEKGDRMTLSPSISDSGNYQNGVELNWCTSSEPLLEEDAAIISEEAVNEKLGHMFMEEHTFILGHNEMLIPAYDSSTEGHFLPEIGEQVREDGVLIAARKHDANSVPRIISNKDTSDVSYTEDRYIRVNPKSEVINIEVNFEPRSIQSELNSKSPQFKQLHKYHLAKLRWTKSIVAIYDEFAKKGYTLSKRMNQLVTRCVTWDFMYGSKSKKLPILKLKDKVIDRVVIKIVTGYAEHIKVGAKIACRSGAKNIVGTVVKRKYMKTDEQGIVADFEFATTSVFNRMNLQQSYEAMINRLNLLQVRTIRTMCDNGNYMGAYDHVLHYLYDVCPDYGKLVDDFVGASKERKMDWVDDILENGIFITMGMYNMDITVERFEFVADKYKYVTSPVTYSKKIDGEWKEFTTKDPVAIGPKQVWLLGKIPSKALLAVATAHVNQFTVPVKVASKDIKNQYACAPTCINFGPDELGLIMNALPGEDATRLIMTLAGCPEATAEYVDTLLTSNDPSNVERLKMSTEEMVAKSETVGTFRNTWSIAGYDVENAL